MTHITYLSYPSPLCHQMISNGSIAVLRVNLVDFEIPSLLKVLGLLYKADEMSCLFDDVIL